MVEKLHKLFLIFVKYLPLVIAIGYFINAILTSLGIIYPTIMHIFYLSPITALFILCASFVFKFCIWHRLPIYYCIILHIISYIDYYTNFLMVNSLALFVYLTLTIFCILLGMYFKNKRNEISKVLRDDRRLSKQKRS